MLEYDLRYIVICISYDVLMMYCVNNIIIRDCMYQMDYCEYIVLRRCSNFFVLAMSFFFL